MRPEKSTTRRPSISHRLPDVPSVTPPPSPAHAGEPAADGAQARPSCHQAFHARRDHEPGLTRSVLAQTDARVLQHSAGNDSISAALAEAVANISSLRQAGLGYGASKAIAIIGLDGRPRGPCRACRQACRTAPSWCATFPAAAMAKQHGRPACCRVARLGCAAHPGRTWSVRRPTAGGRLWVRGRHLGGAGVRHCHWMAGRSLAGCWGVPPLVAIVTRAPPSGRFSAHALPPCASAIAWTTASPSPVG